MGQKRNLFTTESFVTSCAVAAAASVPETTESRSKVSTTSLYDGPHYTVSPGVHVECLRLGIDVVEPNRLAFHAWWSPT